MTSPVSTAPTPEQVLQQLRAARIACQQADRVHGGWSYWTYDVDGRWIVRFSQSDAVAESLNREVALLPHISPHVRFAVPDFRHVGSFRGRPFVAYRRIPGLSLDQHKLDREAEGSVADALTSLHNVPRAPFVQHHPEAASAESWRQRYGSMRPRSQDTLRQFLEPDLVNQFESRWGTFLDRDLQPLSELAVVHYDLGAEHILLQPNGTVSGIIDFEEVTLGDPAVDFAGLLCAFGQTATQSVIERYERPKDSSFLARCRFYALLGSYHAIDHGLETDDRSIVTDGLDGLRRRLETEELGAWLT